MPRLLLAYAGQHHNGHTLTDADLVQAAETSNAIGEAPLTIGHVRGTGHPRYGRVTNFSAEPAHVDFVGETRTALYADVEPLDAVRDAVRDGFYNQRSVGFSRDPEGRYYTHHLAVLGGTPPAVKGLEDLAFDAGDVALTVTIDEGARPSSSGGRGASPTADFYDGSPLTRVLSNEIDRVAATDAYASAGTGARDAVVAAMAAEAEVEPAAVELVLDGDVPRPRTEWLRAFARALGIAEQTLIDTSDFWYADRQAGPVQPPAPMPNDTPTGARPSDPTPSPAPTASGTADFADNPEFVRMRDEMARMRDERKADRLGQLREALAGKFDGDVGDRLVAFADAAFPAEAETIEFADGETTRQADPLAELVEIARAIPDRGYLGQTLDFSDADPGEEAAPVDAGGLFGGPAQARK